MHKEQGRTHDSLRRFNGKEKWHMRDTRGGKQKTTEDVNVRTPWRKTAAADESDKKKGKRRVAAGNKKVGDTKRLSRWQDVLRKMRAEGFPAEPAN